MDRQTLESIRRIKEAMSVRMRGENEKGKVTLELNRATVEKTITKNSSYLQ